MKLAKNRTNNPEGRPKGSRNKVTQQMRERLESLFCQNYDQLQKDIDSLDPKDRVKAIFDLLKYLLPALRSTEYQNNQTEITKVDLSNLTDEELKKLAEFQSKIEAENEPPIKWI